jgi:hypothetical protein
VQLLGGRVAVVGDRIAQPIAEGVQPDEARVWGIEKLPGDVQL